MTVAKKDKILHVMGAVANHAEHCVGAAPLMDSGKEKDAEFEEAIATRDRLWQQVKDLLERYIPDTEAVQ